MRRPGFGSTRDELEAHYAKGYEAAVEDLLHPERSPEFEEDLRLRYYSIAGEGITRVAEALVDQCLDMLGQLEVGEDTRGTRVHSAETGGELRFGTEAEREESAERIGEMLQLVVASREYQFS